MTDLAECTDCPHLGQCCWMSVEMGEHDSGRKIRVYSRVPCHKLDVRTGLCTDYENRLDVPWCLESSDPECNRWPGEFCPHHDFEEGVGEVGKEPQPIMMSAGRYFQVARRGRLSAEQREKFMKLVDRLVVEEIEKQFGVKLEPHLGADYKYRQALRRSALKRNKGPGRPDSGRVNPGGR